MKLTWVGHACFTISNGKKVLIDPYDPSVGYIWEKQRADIVLITHRHGDHSDTNMIEGNYTLVEGLVDKTIHGIKIKGIQEFHDEAGGALRGLVVMYIIQKDGVTFMHTGDLGRVPPQDKIEEILREGPIDVLMIPVGGTYTINAEGAKRVVELLGPRVVIPMHFKVPGVRYPIEGVSRFLHLFPQEKVKNIGDHTVEITKGNLPEETEVWVLLPKNAKTGM